MPMSRSASLAYQVFWYSRKSRQSDKKTAALNGFTKRVGGKHISITLHTVKKKKSSSKFPEIPKVHTIVVSYQEEPEGKSFCIYQHWSFKILVKSKRDTETCTRESKTCTRHQWHFLPVL